MKKCANLTKHLDFYMIYPNKGGGGGGDKTKKEKTSLWLTQRDREGRGLCCYGLYDDGDGGKERGR